jgi:hypothetical protein
MSTVDVRFQHVAAGLRLIYTGLVLSVLTFLVTFLGGMAMGGSMDFKKWNPAFLYIVVGLSILAQICAILGQFRCLDVPEKVKATGAIYAAVAPSVFSIILGLVHFIPGVEVPAWANQVGQPLSFAGLICFLFFLRKLALFLGDPKQISRSGFVLKGTIVLIALVLLVMLVTGLAVMGGRPPQRGLLALVGLVALVAGLGVLILGLVVFVTYANLVDSLRKNIDRMLVGRALE